MTQYDATKCEKTGILARNCPHCMIGQKKVAAPPPPPSSITGGPPPDIEMMDRPALEAELAAGYKANAAVDSAIAKEWDEGTWASYNSDFKEGPLPAQPFKVRPSSHIPPILDAIESGYASFDTLPIDDSHASKVMRAAAEYAAASQAWAVELASVTQIKAGLLKAEAKLEAAFIRKHTSEITLQTLVNGEKDIPNLEDIDPK